MSWLWRRDGLLFFCYLPSPPLFPFCLVPLCWIRTVYCLLVFIDSSCTTMTRCYDKDLHDRFLFIYAMYWYWSHSDSRFIFYRPLAPLFMLTHVQLAVVTQSCALLYITAHCDTYCSRYSIVLLQYISQACWVLCSPRLDFFHCTVISTLVVANRLRSPLPSCLIPLKVIHCNVPKWHALVNYFSSETI